LREIVTGLSRVGALGQVAARTGFGALEAASRQLGIALDIADIKAPEDLDGTFAAMVGKRVQGIVVIVGPLTYLLRKPIADLALKNRLPAISTLSEYAHDGLLITYGPKLTDLYIRAASYVDKILRGARPADLPVEQPSRFELTVNMKTAAALGLLRSRVVLIAAHVALVMPFVVRSVWVSVKNLDPMLGRAAASLGATPWRTFRRVTLQLLAPGLTAGLLFAVIVSLNEFVVSLFVSNRITEILPVAMFSYVVNYTDPTIAAMSSLFIGLTFAAVWLADRFFGLAAVFLLDLDR
jgi:hypothetical protein